MVTYNLTTVGVQMNVRWDFIRKYPELGPVLTATETSRVVGTKVPVYVAIEWCGCTVYGVIFVYEGAVANALRADDLSLLKITLNDFGRIQQGAEQGDDDPLVIRSVKLDNRSYDLYPPPTSA